MGVRETNGALDHGVLADRVDGEPPAILGLTTTELLMLALIVGLVCLPLLIGVASLLNATHIALSLTGFAFMGGMYLGSVVFRRIKRGRPYGYYQVRFAIVLQRVFGGSRFVLRAGPWDLGRSEGPRRIR